MIAKKVLTAADDVIGPFVVPRDNFVQAGVQYGAGGVGTIALEGTRDGTTYLTIGLSKDDGSGVVTTLAASGGGSADVSTFDKVRIRKTVAGGGDVTASLVIASA